MYSCDGEEPLPEDKEERQKAQAGISQQICSALAQREIEKLLFVKGLLPGYCERESHHAIDLNFEISLRYATAIFPPTKQVRF